jgi:membrane protease YdiL (CAAX protease family)
VLTPHRGSETLNVQRSTFNAQRSLSGLNVERWTLNVERFSRITTRMKDGIRLALYLIATIVLGALIAPPLFWAGQAWFPFLARFDFETFFHRALLIAAIALLWPFLRMSNVRALRDLDLAPNHRRAADFIGGALLAIVPLFCCGAALLAFRFYSVRHIIDVHALSKTFLAGIFAPFFEEPLFRGIILGLLLRSGWRKMSIFVTSAFFAAVHFFRSLEQAIADSFLRFADPLSILPAFATLFLIGLILADARVRTRSLWLPIGLHAGWILANGAFNALARRQIDISPWLGKNLREGVIPIAIGAVTWLLMIVWVKYDHARKA